MRTTNRARRPTSRKVHKFQNNVDGLSGVTAEVLTIEPVGASELRASPIRSLLNTE